MWSDDRAMDGVATQVCLLVLMRKYCIPYHEYIYINSEMYVSAVILAEQTLCHIVPVWLPASHVASACGRLVPIPLLVHGCAHEPHKRYTM
jgi:hypothetical protein